MPAGTLLWAGALAHVYWSPTTGLVHETWGINITTDPTATSVGSSQHVWSLDPTQHWWTSRACPVTAGGNLSESGVFRTAPQPPRNRHSSLIRDCLGVRLPWRVLPSVANSN